MAEFQNTIDLFGDDVVAEKIADRTFSGEFVDYDLQIIGDTAFYNCTELTSVNLPSATYIGDAAFYSCGKLTKANTPAVTNISNNAFYGCHTLAVIVLRGTTVCSFSSMNAFQGTPFASGGTGGTAYVPQALIESYQTATNWSALYAAGTCNFVAIEGSEYE